MRDSGSNKTCMQLRLAKCHKLLYIQGMVFRLLYLGEMCCGYHWIRTVQKFGGCPEEKVRSIQPGEKVQSIHLVGKDNFGTDLIDCNKANN